MKVLENCNAVVAASLEQTTWLRKNLQVRIVQSDTTSTQISMDSPNETDRISNSDNATPNFDGSFIHVNFTNIDIIFSYR